MLARVRPTDSPHRTPPKAPTNTSARYGGGIAWTSASTSDWDKNRGASARSDGTGTFVAGLVIGRLSATAASRQWRSANTALRALAGDRPEASISATHSRTAALLILIRGSLPNLGRTCIRIRLEARPRGCSEVVSGSDPVLGPLLETNLTPPGISPGAASEPCLDLGFATLRLRGAVEGLTVFHTGPIAVAHTVSGHLSQPARKISHLDLPTLDVGHHQRLTVC